MHFYGLGYLYAFVAAAAVASVAAVLVTTATEAAEAATAVAAVMEAAAVVGVVAVAAAVASGDCCATVRRRPGWFYSSIHLHRPRPRVGMGPCGRFSCISTMHCPVVDNRTRVTARRRR